MWKAFRLLGTGLVYRTIWIRFVSSHTPEVHSNAQYFIVPCGRVFVWLNFLTEL